MAPISDVVEEVWTPVTVRMMFGQRVRGSEGENVTRVVQLNSSGSDSIASVKEKIASAFGNRVSSSQLQLYFGPNEAILGRHYTDDPAVDESKITLAKYSCLSWLKKFPHWHMSVKFMPPTPLPPGVAAHRAAALSEGKDPDIAVWDARSKGEIPNITSLPKPWGPKSYSAPEKDHSHRPPEAFSLKQLKLA